MHWSSRSDGYETACTDTSHFTVLHFTFPDIFSKGEICDFMRTLTILDVLHIKMDAGHQDTHSLGTLVAQKFHHLGTDGTKS